MDLILENAPLGVRFFTVGSALIYISGGITNLILHTFYTAALISIFALLFGIVALLCEFSPYGLHILMNICPPLGEYKSRGIFYMCVGLLTLGSEMHVIGQLGGSLMLISGACSIVLHYLGPMGHSSFGYDGANGGGNDTSGFERYQQSDLESGVDSYGQM